MIKLNIQRLYSFTVKCLMGLLALPLPVMASDLSEPYTTANRSPFIQIYGLPAAQSAELVNEGKWYSSLSLAASSNATIDHEGSESIVIDGESYWANVRLRYGLTERLEVGLDLPYMSHQPGGLDSFISDWHDTWGLPNGDRDTLLQDQLVYRYGDKGQTVVEQVDSAEGMGDVSLSAAYQLAHSTTRQWALRTGVKFATGDADQLLGSGATDIYLSANISDQSLLVSHSLAFHTSLGVLWMGDGDIIEASQNDWVAYGSGTMSWAVTDSISLKAQLDAHSAFYDSALKELGSGATQLTLGGSICLTKGIILDLAVSEDIAVDTAPDVTFQVGLSFREQ